MLLTAFSASILEPRSGPRWRASNTSAISTGPSRHLQRRDALDSPSNAVARSCTPRRISRESTEANPNCSPSRAIRPRLYRLSGTTSTFRERYVNRILQGMVVA
jgi:hypothetical protein